MTHDHPRRRPRPPRFRAPLAAAALLFALPLPAGLSVAAANAPPDTTITAVLELIDTAGQPIGPGNITLSNAVAFEFQGQDDLGVAGFECRFGGSDFETCESPAVYTDLALGRYEFAVRAVDGAGNRDASPAGSTITVEQAPVTIFRSAIDGRGVVIENGGASKSSTIMFVFAGTDNGSVAGFECSLDKFGVFQPYSSPITYKRVDRGPHTFRVRTVDNLGIRDIGAVFVWARR